MKLMEYVKEKKILTLEEVAEFLGTDVEEVKEFISCGDLVARGPRKERVTVMSLARFLEEEIEPAENEERGIDTTGNQRYNPPHSIVIEDLSNEEWEEMKRNGAKELKPYWNESRNKWCIALSLGCDENNKRIRKVITADTQEEVWRKYGEFNFNNTVLPAEVKEAVIENVKHLKAEMFFGQYFKEYLATLDGSVHSRTYNSKIKLSKYIINGLGNYRMEELDIDKIRKFINGLTKEKYEKGGKIHELSQSTINKIYDLLHGAIKDASSVGKKILVTDFMKEIKRPESQKYTEDREYALTNEEFRKISEILKKENKMMYLWVQIMMYTGARPSEVLAIKFSDIDYNKKIIKIVRTLSHEEHYDIETRKKIKTDNPVFKDLKNVRKNNKRNYQKRELELSERMINIIKEWEDKIKNNSELVENRCANDMDEYLFSGTTGQKWLYRDYRRVYERILKRNGLSVTEYNPYRYRHSFCIECFRKNIDPKTVQVLMGDNDLAMILRVYANLNKEDILKGSRNMSKVMDDILGA